jgi:hypothetical protein
MYTRKDYLDKKCTHRQYYAQFVDDNVKKRVFSLISLKKLLSAKDEYLNDIKLELWDRVLSPLPTYIGDKIRDSGTFPSLSDCVCIAKEAAKQIIEENKG